MFFGNNKFEIFYNGIDIKKYKFNSEIRNKIRNKLDIKKDELAFVHVGRFDYAKNHSFLIDIFKEINHIHKKTKLFLVGDGELQDKIKKKVTELNLEKKVIFLNKRKNVNEILQGMDAFIFPSNYEGLPIAMIEAQASGLYIFASDNISSESKISNLVEFISLENEPRVWAKKIMQNKKIFEERLDMEEGLMEKGYDIINSVKNISRLYTS